MSNYLVAENDLETLLVALCVYGRPRISKMPDGWFCRVEMHVPQKGCTFEVKSEITCESPTTAARQCLDRVTEALKALTPATDEEKQRSEI